MAGCLSWIWPPFVIYKLTHQWGFYAERALYAALLLLLALRMVERPTRGRVGLFGLVLGLALWQSAQLVPVVVPVIAWAVWRERAWLRHAWLAVVLAVVGALPSIVWNVTARLGVVHVPDRRHDDVRRTVCASSSRRSCRCCWGCERPSRRNGCCRP